MEAEEPRFSQVSPEATRRYGPPWRRHLFNSPSSLVSPLAMASAHESPRLSIQSAMAKGAELRALQAALLQGNPATPKSPLGFRPSSLSKGSDYPVFTPTYDEEPSPMNHHIRSKSQQFLNNSTRDGIEAEDENIFYGWMEPLSPSMFREDEIARSCSNHDALKEARERGERFNPEDQDVVAVCNKCKPAGLNEVHRTNPTRPSVQNQRGLMSWLFPKFRRKPNTEASPRTSKYEQKSQVSFKKELTHVTDSQNSAISEVCEMRSSLVELRRKLGHLEGYCQELKKALAEATHGEPCDPRTTRITPLRSPAPASDEVMVEGFLQMVSEARLSVKHLGRSLMAQFEESGTDIAQKIDLARSSRGHSREIGYHLQALINRNFYQDFENCVFQKNGSQRILDLWRERQENFSSFLYLRSLSWREILNRGSTQRQLEDIVKFCEQKMVWFLGLMDGSGPRGEHMRENFFVAAKCVWLLHLLAFSFSPPLAILRVEEKRRFDHDYMEDVVSGERRLPGCVKLMVSPGFYVQDRVVRCKVLCSRGSVG